METVTFTSLLDAAISGPSPLLGSWRLFWFLFSRGGWVVLAAGVVGVLWHNWMLYIEHDYAKKNRRWVLLAIDVPKDNIQTPLAVENIFAHLAGAHGSKTKLEKYWQGNTQDYFCLELVSIEGYVQYIIRTADKFRDLVEAAVYSQYPDAQITEIEDYTTGYPTVFPNDRYDMYGTEFVYAENEGMPIRTYPEFEHKLSQEFKDPLNAILETMSKLGPGEQLWLQILVVPIDNKWKKHIVEKIKSLSGRSSHSPGVLSRIAGEMQKFGQSATDQFAGRSGVLEPGESHRDSLGGLLLLSPFEREQVEAMARKVKKIGFKTKIRSVYIATKERFNVQHGREALVGAIKQFNTEDLNSLKPDTKHVGVHASYFFTEWRKNRKRTKLMHRYVTRHYEYGREPIVMNIEELATIWHFPSKTLTQQIRPMVQRTEFKHTPPPTTLPYASELVQQTPEKRPPAPPPNLPGSH